MATMMDRGAVTAVRRGWRGAALPSHRPITLSDLITVICPWVAGIVELTLLHEGVVILLFTLLGLLAHLSASPPWPGRVSIWSRCFGWDFRDEGCARDAVMHTGGPLA